MADSGNAGLSVFNEYRSHINVQWVEKILAFLSIYCCYPTPFAPLATKRLPKLSSTATPTLPFTWVL